MEHTLSRRSFLGASAALAAASSPLFAAGKKPVLGLELYSVRNELAKDLPGTLKAVAKMGYEGVEFFGPYADWKLDYAKEVRKMLDDLNLKALSAHTGAKYFTPDELARVAELNLAIGSKYIVMSSAGRVTTLDGWKEVGAKLTAADAQLKKLKLRTGFHNHATEFTPLEGKRPIEVLAATTPKSVVLQLDVGTCLQAGSDPIEWTKANPGRIVSLHLKDWKNAPGHEGYRILLGEGYGKFKELIQTAGKSGGLEYVLVEQEGHELPALEASEKCLQNLKKILG
ncbi:MAG: sugar phosphate isomerase/epimerase [Bryobacterales bacterium]|nr:sugar phosphate isomerase/epimerase [Bryobacterales bacterium]